MAWPAGTVVGRGERWQSHVISTRRINRASNNQHRRTFLRSHRLLDFCSARHAFVLSAHHHNHDARGDRSLLQRRSTGTPHGETFDLYGSSRNSINRFYAFGMNGKYIRLAPPRRANCIKTANHSTV
ncbi:hypothetical protein K438DRAFT_331379 [Mycena galopus ATCC 62051]|nr:hypothetical protein K438DRAFT_331379 [Mycena galopus ATCC 62051]